MRGEDSAAHFQFSSTQSSRMNYRLVRPVDAVAAAAFGGCTGCFPASAVASFCASGEGFPLLTSPLGK